ncbi:Competence protein A [Novipirellula galeiformis]|uniref:Competence protein A n=1 Tax=Novipirellula galeiformis TaxID=2528004 RepID=A0A5C6CVK7_9BACT|nr:hypothetical protein [Novipirellula galeiformis]TWU27006.1 Competence protein A [Novipirellula galeiformis]
MPKKLAIDWDETELRFVAAQCTGTQVTITDAAVIPMLPSGIFETLRKAISEHGLEKTETLVAIGRGKAELRELQFPPVPDEELPDIVRFQAIRTFASAGESATIDYLVTHRTSANVNAIVAAVAPPKLEEVKEVCAAASLPVNRITLRPLSAAAFFLTRSNALATEGDVVLIDLLSHDAEIVVSRDNKVIFVRTVRMPTDASARPRALVNELKRSLLACGSKSPEKIVLWGREAVHRSDVALLSEAIDTPVEVANPFDLVDVDAKLKSQLPDHVGRLAPLVGLLVCDETHAGRLIDFLHPRERVEEKKDHRRTALFVGVPVAAVLLLGYFGYHKLSKLDAEIERLSKANAAMKMPVEEAEQFIAETEKVDQFLDADAIWIDEIRTLATKLPPAEEVILKSIVATSDIRSGVSTVVLSGSATHPSVIEKLEASIRDENHSVTSEGASEQDAKNAYRWVFTEKIAIPPHYARVQRYAGIEAALAATEAASEDPMENAAEDTVEDSDPASKPAALESNIPKESDIPNESDAETSVVPSAEVQS